MDNQTPARTWDFSYGIELTRDGVDHGVVHARSSVPADALAAEKARPQNRRTSARPAGALPRPRPRPKLVFVDVRLPLTRVLSVKARPRA